VKEVGVNMDDHETNDRERIRLTQLSSKAG